MSNNTEINKSTTSHKHPKTLKKQLLGNLLQNSGSEVSHKVLRKILILGSKGMLGGQFVKLFGSRAVGWDREECNILNASELTEKIERLAPSAVINCVAFNDVDGAEDKSDAAFKLNVEAVGVLAKVCKKLDIPFVQFSTNYVFSGKLGEYAETEEPDPQSIYGKTKHQGEIELEKNTDKYYLVRTAVLFGPEGESALSKKSFVGLMLGLASKNENISAVGDEVNSLTYVVDLARAVEVLLKEQKPYGIYHLVNSGEASWYDFAKEVFNITKKNINLIKVPASDFPRKASRPAKSVLLNTKFIPLRSWQEALEEYLNSKS